MLLRIKIVKYVERLNMNKPKLRSSVSVVDLNDNIIEFFLTNTRRQVRIKITSKKILDLILNLDGELTIDEIVNKYNIDLETKEYLIKFLNYLESKSIIEDNIYIDIEEGNKYRRVINFIGDFSSSKVETKRMWSNIRNSHVVIIGLGAVGSWVSSLLVQNGIKEFTLIDNDTVDITNLHRQFGFSENDIGLLKTDVIEKRLKEFNRNVKVNKINKFLDENLLDNNIDYKVDLIINCAD
ncbi:hypothetical protein CYK85_15570, partial [Clostridium perfringens]